MNLCEPCMKAGHTACHYCRDFISSLTYPVKKAKPKKINIASGEDVGMMDDNPAITEEAETYIHC